MYSDETVSTRTSPTPSEHRADPSSQLTPHHIGAALITEAPVTEQQWLTRRSPSLDTRLTTDLATPRVQASPFTTTPAVQTPSLQVRAASPSQRSETSSKASLTPQLIKFVQQGDLEELQS